MNLSNLFREVYVYIFACNELQIATLVQMALTIKILKFEVCVNFGFSEKDGVNFQSNSSIWHYF